MLISCVVFPVSYNRKCRDLRKSGHSRPRNRESELGEKSTGYDCILGKQFVGDECKNGKIYLLVLSSASYYHLDVLLLDRKYIFNL